jgi:hypothetical protein
MLVKNYESFLQKLNFEIQNWNFDVEKNKDYIEKIIEIYNESKLKNFTKVKELIEWLQNFFLENTNIVPPCPSAENVWAISTTRSWETNIQDEENIENFNSVEVISAIFLQNLKEELWKR